MAEKPSESEEHRVVGFVGVGLDNSDGDKRLTRSEHFILIGGSQETHERMQDTAIRFAAGLRRRRKRLDEAAIEEVIDLFREAQE